MASADGVEVVVADEGRRYSVRSLHVRPSSGFVICRRLLLGLLASLLVVSVANTIYGVHEIVVAHGSARMVAFFLLVSIGEDLVTLVGLAGAYREHYGLLMTFTIVKAGLLFLSLFTFSYYTRVQYMFYLFEWVSAAQAFGFAVRVRNVRGKTLLTRNRSQL